MRRATFFGLLIGLALVPRFAVADEPADARPKPTAAALVEGVIAEESKVEDVRSLYLRFEGKWTRPLPALAREMAEMKGRNEIVDVDRNSNLWPEMTEELEFAFDEKRVRRLSHWHKSSWTLRVFDGELAVSHEKYFLGLREYYALANSADQFSMSISSDLSWLRVGPYRLEYKNRRLPAAESEKLNGLPRDYVFVDDADYRGRPCYVVENRIVHRRLFIGKEDRRLHGLLILVMPNNVDLLPTFNLVAEREFATQREAEEWAKNLFEADRKRYAERMNLAMFGLMRPWSENFLDDYREIAPGLWFPATQGYTMYDINIVDTPIEFTRTLRLTEAKVDQPLDDKLFQCKLTDGVLVYDYRHEVPLTYPQNSKRTPEEWQKLIDEQKKNNTGRKKR